MGQNYGSKYFWCHQIHYQTVNQLCSKHLPAGLQPGRMRGELPFMQDCDKLSQMSFVYIVCSHFALNMDHSPSSEKWNRTGKRFVLSLHLAYEWNSYQLIPIIMVLTALSRVLFLKITCFGEESAFLPVFWDSGQLMANGQVGNCGWMNFSSLKGSWEKRQRWGVKKIKGWSKNVDTTVR